MKNVAATSGHSVSFAALFLGDVSTWEGIWAGTDMLLNSYDRPPERIPVFAAAVEQLRIAKNTSSAPARNKKMHAAHKFFAHQSSFALPFQAARTRFSL